MEPSRPSKRVITYGTFDLFHKGHRNILQRARQLGNYLIVAVGSDAFDYGRGKLRVRQSLPERIKNIERSGLADKIIIEEYENQAVQDVQKYKIDVYTIGSDWKGKFDHLRRYCEVVYLDRTPGISSTQLRGITRMGIIGAGNAATKFALEASYVSGLVAVAAFGWSNASEEEYEELVPGVKLVNDLEELYSAVDAVYIASPISDRGLHVKEALEHQMHVICRRPLCLAPTEVKALYKLASTRGLVLFEDTETAYLPAFDQLVGAAQDGSIGRVVSISARCTMLREPESGCDKDGGSINELASYPLLAVAKILGTEATSVGCRSILDERNAVDIWSQIDVSYPGALASCMVAVGARAEGDLVIAGTTGYIYVPSPWWLTKSFSFRYGEESAGREVVAPFTGNAMRYMMAAFVQKLDYQPTSPGITPAESLFIVDTIQKSQSSREIL